MTLFDVAGKCPRARRLLIAAALISLATSGAATAQLAEPDLATVFGARPQVTGVRISPSGKYVSYFTPNGAVGTALMVVDIDSGRTSRALSTTDGKYRLVRCDWESDEGFICDVAGTAATQTKFTDVGSLVAVAREGGGKLVPLGRPLSDRAITTSTQDARVVDLSPEKPNEALISDYQGEEDSRNTRIYQAKSGQGVWLIDTRTARRTLVEPVIEGVVTTMADARGVVRVRAIVDRLQSGYDSDRTKWSYRPTGSRTWAALAETDSNDFFQLSPLAIDESGNWLYASRGIAGRDTIVRIALDGSLREETVFADNKADVNEIRRIGGRIIGVSYEAPACVEHYIDPAFERLSVSLAKALTVPCIRFESADRSLNRLVVATEGPSAPTHYYLFDRTSKKLESLLSAMPQITLAMLAPSEIVTIDAADGSLINAVLVRRRGLDGAAPAIILYNVSGASDFADYAQFYAASGYTVLLPAYRGDTALASASWAKNGFAKWSANLVDVAAAARWLVNRRLADPARIAVGGYGYGGYAALAGAVANPGMFKAVIAIEPLVDLDLARDQQNQYLSNYESNRRGMQVAGVAPSPLKQAARVTSPVMIFHSEANVEFSVAQSRAMDAALRGAGKISELSIYPGPGRLYADSTARADLLRRSAAFLARAMGPPLAAPVAAGASMR